MSEWGICGKRNSFLCFKPRRISCFDNKFWVAPGDLLAPGDFATITARAKACQRLSG
jgi:hypothetical protein